MRALREGIHDKLVVILHGTLSVIKRHLHSVWPIRAAPRPCGNITRVALRGFHLHFTVLAWMLIDARCSANP